MSIGHHSGNPFGVTVVSADSMYHAIREKGIIPFFANDIKGYSIEELTAPQFWFDSDENENELGPWDWKIDCVQTGDIVYGKFLKGKAAFATPTWYRELMNYRRSLPKYQFDEKEKRILDYLMKQGTITIKEVRKLLDVKKNVADALIGKLMMQCRVITGDIQRVYRGENLTYVGWQVSTFCTPEDYFEEEMLPDCTPEESRQRLLEHLMEITGEKDEKKLERMIL